MHHLFFSLSDIGVGFLALSNVCWSIWISARVRALWASHREQTLRRFIPRALPRVERPVSIPAIYDWFVEPTLRERRQSAYDRTQVG